ncbi:NADP-dependent phosphogluconate dehydrogenase [Candidatus Nomurabacteria bacterium]|nr:NADP-dependent phosphogluconate dehydrogenase [Candidatus Nomurabacteria bacterium]
MTKELVFIGLGKMGSAMTARLVAEGYVVHGFDVSVDMRLEAEKLGVKTYDSIAEAITSISGRKVIWLMVPSKFVDSVLAEICISLATDDIIIDGGNSFFKDTIKRAAETKSKGFYYVDCGTSGGVNGARNGASLMVGGDNETISYIENIFMTLAAPNAYGHVGGTGAGHFVKMVHNGIEYGMAGAIAEGMAFIEDNAQELKINQLEVLKPFEHESIIASKLMTWMSEVYKKDAYLENISGEVPKGETEEEMEFIVSHRQTPVLEAALLQRKETRENPSRIGSLISALRNQFGGHKTIQK